MNAVQPSPHAAAAAVPADGSRAAFGRLRIHAGRPARLHPVADLKALWQRLWRNDPALGPCATQDPVQVEPQVQVEVQSVQGRRLFALRDPEGVVELTVGPDIYDITVLQGHRRRRYTVPLEPGGTFDLDLREAPQAR